jgi:hypothetical protein
MERVELTKLNLYLGYETIGGFWSFRSSKAAVKSGTSRTTGGTM